MSAISDKMPSITCACSGSDDNTATIDGCVWISREIIIGLENSKPTGI